MSQAQRFDREMIGVYQRAKAECGYTATRFLQMIGDKGGLRTAKELLGRGEVSEGFTALWEHHRLDLTMEALVLKPENQSLFTADELAIARARLEAVDGPGPTKGRESGE